MDSIVAILTEDYRRFPKDQTYAIYAENVYFEDPINRFHGVARYQHMIGWMAQWFDTPRIELDTIERQGNLIKTCWTLRWKAPLPWKPPIAISGWSELQLNAENLVVSHIDYWNCSRFDVVKQHFGRQSI
jgi:hypothetical protein